MFGVHNLAVGVFVLIMLLLSVPTGSFQDNPILGGPSSATPDLFLLHSHHFLVHLERHIRLLQCAPVLLRGCRSHVRSRIRPLVGS